MRGGLIVKGIVAGSALLMAAHPATAQTFDLGTIAPGATVQRAQAWLGSAALTDTYSFSIAAGDNSSLSFSRGNYGLTGFVGSLFRDSNPTAISTFGAQASGGSDTTDLGKIGVGSYRLTVTGTPTNLFMGQGASGFYSLTLASTAAAPVPGPAGWLVAGAGLAMLGFGYRRRSIKSSLKASLT